MRIMKLPTRIQAFSRQSAKPELDFQLPIERLAPELVSHIASHLGLDEQLFLGLSIPAL